VTVEYRFSQKLRPDHDGNVEATDTRSERGIRTHRGAVVGTCVLVGGILVALFALWPREGTPGFTGVAVTVPRCPADVDGCRVLVTNEGNGSLAAHHDWSGAAATLKVVLPSGRYAVSAEGCTGDKIGNSAFTVTSGFHATIDLGNAWELPGFVGRTCPGFVSAAPG
jgi:hypothetical protein